MMMQGALHEEHAISYSAKEKKVFAAIWLKPDEPSARAYANLFMVQYESLFPKAIEVLEAGLADSIRFY
jgi:hypothetical protein